MCTQKPPHDTATEARAALEMEDLLQSFVSSGFGGHTEATMAPYSDGQVAAETGGGAGEGGLLNIFVSSGVKLNRKGKIPI
jgi:hypothetical protein